MKDQLPDQSPTRRCAYLTMDDISAFVSDAAMSVAAMNELGWGVDFVSWRSPEAEWDRYDLVYICTPWDYQDDPDAFLRVLETIDVSSALLVNPLETVRWNLDKNYLRELQANGARIVPSRWHDTWSDDVLPEARDEFDSHRLVIKPQVGANADHTYVVDAENPGTDVERLEAAFRDRPFFVQPFLESITAEGEYSLFYFGGCYSHAILKKPKAGDFRSQEEHGADILYSEANDAMRSAAERMLATLDPEPVYARVDYLRGPGDEFLLMELEVNEPSLYFRVDEYSMARFAKALDDAYRASLAKGTNF